MVKSLSSARKLPLINLILGWVPHVLIISFTINLSLFGSYFELILTGTVLVVFCTILLKNLLKILDNSLSSVIVLLPKLIAISSL